MYRVSFHLVSIVLGLALAVNVPNTQPSLNSTLPPRQLDLGAAVIKWRHFQGLSKEQRMMWSEKPKEAAVVLQGMEVAMEECQHQLRWHRWNCSSLHKTKSRKRSISLLNKGYKESAFAYALTSAGVMHAIIKACHKGILPGCCGEVDVRDSRKFKDEKGTQIKIYKLGASYEFNEVFNDTAQQERLSQQSRNSWKWKGCPANLRYGAKYSELFLDLREMSKTDLQSDVILHNYRAGREAVSKNARQRCKCHGVSGSCTLSTCWLGIPEFRSVGNTLMGKFKTAIFVKQDNLGRNAGRNELEIAEETDNSINFLRGRTRRYYLWKNSTHLKNQHMEPQVSELLYFKESPTFCNEADDSPGTVGRRCNKSSTGTDGCDTMCCGRGYDSIRAEKRYEKCSCRFEWCCQVMCKNCTIDEEVTVCK
ncbi:Hypothetical predicted protein [Cloeon dipterum]|uniref:Protein Wnt n=1 Tax=Cloeon dipterum TaxID=197152 RepID=A0A8S1CJD4_9INSE|nr:Hypothetical predicted protein [Cloeon dipterum]